MKYFLLIDIFGSKAHFTINGRKTYQTVFGALMTIISYIIIFIFFLIFSKEIIYHRKPNIITSDLIDSSPIHFMIPNEFMRAQWSEAKAVGPKGESQCRSVLFRPALKLCPWMSPILS
jgi:hypothetical protein